MDNIKEYVEKLIKKADDSHAYYSFGKEYRSTMDNPLYFVTIVWTLAGLSTYQLKAESQKELLESLKRQYRNMKSNKLIIDYHQNQIDFNEKSIKYHKKVIKDINDSHSKTGSQ